MVGNRGDNRPAWPGRRPGWLAALARGSVFPALLIGPLVAAAALHALGWPRLVILVACLTASLIVQLGLERILPYRAHWQEGHPVAADLVCMGLGAITNTAVEMTILVGVLAAGTALSAALGATLWPTTWPFAAQLILAVAIADLAHYWIHRQLHQVPFLWGFHQMHHRPDHLYTLNFFRMHPLDIALKAVANCTPLILLGTPADVMLLWMVASGVSAGSLNHANIDARTGWLDGIFSTPALHRWHHSRNPAEHHTNFGNITVIYDRIFGTYCCPVTRQVAEVGAPAGSRRLLVELAGPFTAGVPARWQA